MTPDPPEKAAYIVKRASDQKSKRRREEKTKLTSDENRRVERIQSSNASVRAIDVAGDLKSTSVRMSEL